MTTEEKLKISISLSTTPKLKTKWLCNTNNLSNWSCIKSYFSKITKLVGNEISELQKYLKQLIKSMIFVLKHLNGHSTCTV